MNIEILRGMTPSRPQVLPSKQETKRTRLLVAGSLDRLAYWKAWRDGDFDLVLLGSWPNESLTRPDES